MSHMRLTESPTVSLPACAQSLPLPPAITDCAVWGGKTQRNYAWLIAQQQAGRNARLPEAPTGAEVWCHVLLNSCRKTCLDLGCRRVGLADLGCE